MGKKSSNVWVIRYGDKWAVRREGADRVSRVTDTQGEAVHVGKNIAEREGGELIIQDRRGKIRSKDSYGNDPNPPKDKEH